MLAARTGTQPSPLTRVYSESKAERIELRIPWSCLVSDNAKYGVLDGKLIAQKPYREAKKRIHALALEVMGDRPSFLQPVALVARVWMPDNRRHDLTNSCKLVHDALEDAVVEDDSQLHDVRWIRAGVDVDAPRAELTITPL
jgi:Holliday junction resolvase RusA-like endonuclease